MQPNDPIKEQLARFCDPAVAARYADGPVRFVPGLADLHRMTAVLLAERAPPDASVLVLGAGGGLELKALASAQPGWRFVGVDPAAAMLAEAKRTVGPDRHRITFCEGYIDDAPAGPFDAAACLLTLHFLDRDERVRTAREIRRRLKPGAPFVAAHSSIPGTESERAIWVSRYAAFAIAAGADPDHVNQGRATIAASSRLFFGPEENAAVLREAGFIGVEMFYAAFTWRGWIAYA